MLPKIASMLLTYKCSELVKMT